MLSSEHFNVKVTIANTGIFVDFAQSQNRLWSAEKKDRNGNAVSDGACVIAGETYNPIAALMKTSAARPARPT